MSLAKSTLGSRFKRYPRYRDTGVEWLGEIPEHWEARRVKSFATVSLSNVDKKSVAGHTHVTLCNYVDVYNAERIGAESNFMPATATPEQVRRFSLRRGDVLATKDSETWLDIAVPAFVHEDLPEVLCGYHLAHIRPSEECEGAYLNRCLAAARLRDQFQVEANGVTRFGLTGAAIANGLLPLPPIREQRAIVRFLDRETERIDALLEQKTHLTALLKEQRTALISRTVVRGLVADVPMKRGVGCEWLGEIPTHWEVWRLKHLLSEPLTYGASESGCPHDPALPRYVRITDILPNGALREKGCRSIAEDLATPYLLAENDILFARSGSVGLTARCKPDWGRAAFAGYLVRARLGTRADSAFVEYFTRSSYYGGWLRLNAIQATIQNISAERYNSLSIPMPGVCEQRQIVTFLDRETAKIDALVAKVQEAIERLKEYRLALIFAAVTGNIDVRGEAAH